MFRFSYKLFSVLIVRTGVKQTELKPSKHILKVKNSDFNRIFNNKLLFALNVGNKLLTVVLDNISFVW